LKFEFFKKNYIFKSLKINHQNCSLSWPHIWKVLFWALNAENLVYLTWNDPYALDRAATGTGEDVWLEHSVQNTVISLAVIQRIRGEIVKFDFPLPH
jgi:hypothetical protein